MLLTIAQSQTTEPIVHSRHVRLKSHTKQNACMVFQVYMRLGLLPKYYSYKSSQVRS